MTNFLLHKHRKCDEHFQRPEGLNELLSDISREVLRAQPKCIYTFVADYLDAMLIAREQTLVAQRALTTVFDLSMTIGDLLHNVGLARQTSNQSAQIIEEEIRQSLASGQQADEAKIAPTYECAILRRLETELGFSAEQLCKAQKIIQACFKDYYFREKEFKNDITRLPDTVWTKCVEKTLDIYRKTAPEKWELERAATAIQSAYRSYYTRRKLWEDKQESEAATKIQANYRGHLVRANMTQIQMSENLAAIRIQAMYRGHLVRKDNHHQSISSAESVEIMGDVPSLMPIQEAVLEQTINVQKQMSENLAAIRIQAMYRGHLVRKDNHHQSISSAESVKIMGDVPSSMPIQEAVPEQTINVQNISSERVEVMAHASSKNIVETGQDVPISIYEADPPSAALEEVQNISSGNVLEVMGDDVHVEGSDPVQDEV